MATKSPEPGKRSMSTLRQLSMAMELPFVMIAAVLAGGGCGYLLDRWLHTSPVATLVGGLLGLAGGMWEIVRRLSRDEGKQGSGRGCG